VLDVWRVEPCQVDRRRVAVGRKRHRGRDKSVYTDEIAGSGHGAPFFLSTSTLVIVYLGGHVTIITELWKAVFR